MNALLNIIPVQMRLPLKFGNETIQSIQIAHVELSAYGVTGRGETPLSVAWGWPSQALSFVFREQQMIAFCELLAEEYGPDDALDPMTTGYAFLTQRLPVLLEKFNEQAKCEMPYLAALICVSAFDIALHDAFGIACKKPTFQTYNESFMHHDLAWFFKDDAFIGKYPGDFLVAEPPETLPVWHLVGGKDLLRESEKTGHEPDDGYPVSLEKWIERDGLKCLKIKLRGTDAEWDYQRLISIGKIAEEYGCDSLSPDFNCLVTDPSYVIDVLERVQQNAPETYQKIIYVEQPFPHDLSKYAIDVHNCASIKPLFMDESAHDWTYVRMGHQLGWNGVALKVCKTMTGTLLSACWAKQHKMSLMVQDLTNPMLAVIPHVLLAANIGTIRGVECNAPQFYPTASLEFEKIHPGLYERRNGIVSLKTLTGNGFSMNVV